MALFTDRIIYRLSAVWWTAIYAGLSRPRVSAGAAQHTHDPSSIETFGDASEPIAVAA